MGQVGRWIVDELIIYDMTREKYVKFYFNQNHDSSEIIVFYDNGKCESLVWVRLLSRMSIQFLMLYCYIC